MNTLTENLVRKIAKENKAMAKRNDADFREVMRIEHWNLMLDRYGVDLKQRAMELLSITRPEFFDQDGYLYEYADMVFDLDRLISCLAVRVMQRKIKRNPDLQLQTDWGDLPALIADPQLKLL